MPDESVRPERRAPVAQFDCGQFTFWLPTRPCKFANKKEKNEKQNIIP
jgi:hypothetical protein